MNQHTMAARLSGELEAAGYAVSITIDEGVYRVDCGAREGSTLYRRTTWVRRSGRGVTYTAHYMDAYPGEEWVEDYAPNSAAEFIRQLVRSYAATRDDSERLA